MNEPKRRGRPSNAEKAARAAAVQVYEVPDIPDEIIQKAWEETPVVNLAQAYANRVWAGQSDHVPRVERLERVRKALEGQGLSMEGVVL